MNHPIKTPQLRAESEDDRQDKVTHLYIVLVTFLAGSVLAGLTWHVLESERIKSLQRMTQSAAETARFNLDQALNERIRSLNRMADRWTRRGGVPSGEWSRDSLNYLNDMPGIFAISWADRTGQVRRIAPAEGNESVLGFDLNSEKQRRETLAAARDSGRIRSSPIIQLKPLMSTGPGVLVMIPVFREGRHDGVIVGVFEIRRLLESALHFPDHELTFMGPDGVRYYTSPVHGALHPAVGAETGSGSEFLPGRLYLRATESFVQRARSPLQTYLSLVGLLISASITYLVHTLLRRRRSERLLESAQHELQSYKDAMDRTNIVAFTDSQGRITYVNDLFCRISGYERHELIGRDHRIVNSGLMPKSMMKDLWDTIRDGRPWHGQICNRAKDGSLYWVDTNIVPFMGADERPEKFIAIRRDITTQRKIERQLQESSKMSSLGEMAAGLAHELNTPLANIKGRAQQLKALIAAHALTPDALTRHLGSIDQTVDRIAKIVRGLKTFSRDASQDPMEDVSVSGMIDETLAFCGSRFKSHGVELRVRIAEGDLRLSCRPAQISQVLLNLLNNAFDAVHLTRDPWVEVEALQAGDGVEIRVTDCGPGIPPEIRARIMQPFFTTKEVGKGTGLGLSIARGIMEAHRGRIDLDPDHPQTRFVLRLPALNAAGISERKVA